MRAGWLGAMVALAAACGDDGGVVGTDPDTAPVIAVDRFGDFGTLQSRANDPSLPAAGEPMNYDTITTKGLGPDGELLVYYNFDVQSRVPMVVYELATGDGEPVPEQLPILSAVPGEPGYSDFWRITRVTVPDDYVANTFTAAGEVSALPAVVTDVVLNNPVVSEGSLATVRIGGGDTGTARAWRAGAIAHYFRFAEHSIVPIETGIFEGQVPLSYIFVSFNINPGEDGGGPPSGFKTETGSDQTHNVLATIPADEFYSPLWMVNVYDNADFDSVIDHESARQATLVANPPGEVNCPVKSIE